MSHIGLNNEQNNQTNLHKAYLIKESLIGGTISLFISILFVFLVFSTDSLIPINGTKGLVFDAIPQSFGIAFMATLMPTLLTRKRIYSGKINKIKGRYSRLPHNALVRSVLVAFVVTMIALTIHFFVFRASSIESLSFINTLIFKALYGALLGTTVAYYALINALSTSALLAKNQPSSK